MNGKSAKKLKVIAGKSSNPVKAYNILKELYSKKLIKMDVLDKLDLK